MFIFYHSFQNLKLYTQLTVAWTLFVGFLNVHCLFFVGSFTIISFVSYWTFPYVPPEDGWGHCDEWQSLAKLEGWEGCCNKCHGEGTGCFMGVGTDSFWPSLEDWVKFPTKVNRVKLTSLTGPPDHSTICFTVTFLSLFFLSPRHAWLQPHGSPCQPQALQAHSHHRDFPGSFLCLNLLPRGPRGSFPCLPHILD